MVTGATAGIGLEFATQLAARGHDLVLVARDATRLEATAGRLRTAYGIGVEVLAADLGVRADLARVADRVADGERPVDVLVNNAGFGLGRGFLDTEITDEEALLDVLCRAVLVLTHAAARTMRERGHGRIINVSSVASFIAGSSYSAAKSYVTVLTESVAGRLAGTGVTATAVCPGFVHTEFHQRAGLTMGGMPESVWIPVQKVVREALADADRGRVVSIPGRGYRAVVAVLRVAPRSITRNPRLIDRHRKGK